MANCFASNGLFDIFQIALIVTKPEVSNFFTIHVASMIHRYWKYSLPEDFRGSLNLKDGHFHSSSIAFAMDEAVAQVLYLMEYVDKNNGRLMIASSMGQKAINRGKYFGEWSLTDIQKSLKVIKWHSQSCVLLSMQSDFKFRLTRIKMLKNSYNQLQD